MSKTSFWTFVTKNYKEETLFITFISDVQPEIFQGKESFWNEGKHFIYNTQKKGPTWQNFEVYSSRYCENWI